jgi:hypothetical protein
MNETYAKKKKNLAAVLLCFKFNQRQVWLHHALPRELNRIGSDLVSRNLSTDLNKNEGTFLFPFRTQEGATDTRPVLFANVIKIHCTTGRFSIMDSYLQKQRNLR